MKTIILCGLLAALALVFVPPERSVAKQTEDVMALSTEACAICEHCAYPGAPCRHPELMFPCVESHGIIVTALAEKEGIDFYGGNLVTWFSLLLFRE